MFKIDIIPVEDRRKGVTLEQKGNTATSGKGSGANSNKDTSGARKAYDQLMGKGK